jgi:hypothetical protein
MKRELARRAKVMEELKSIALNKQETESFTLKWAGEKDAKAHLLAQLEKDRRQSFQLRNKECDQRHRELDKEAYNQTVGPRSS